MITEDEVLNAMAEALTSIEGLQQSAYMLSNTTGPTVEMIPGQITLGQTFQRGVVEYDTTVRVTVGTSADIGAQKRLRRFREMEGPESIRAALEADRTLGGMVDALQVTEVSPMRQFRRPTGENVLGCDFGVHWWIQP